MGVEICFDDYLRSIVNTHQKWEEWYTPTDATGKEFQQVDRDRPAFFDFGLMVQTVESPKAEQERESEQNPEKKEKIERLPVLEGICKYAAEHVLLVGRPGSGKSTALARLLLQEAENALSIARAKIPVLVELRYLPSEANESSVCDRIIAFMHKHDPALNLDEAGIKQLLRQGRLLLLVDGVNELPSDRGRVMVNQFRELYQRTCPMIFTTRELSAGGDLGIAKRLEMQSLTEPQMQQFVMAYLPTQGERLLRQLSGRLREFGQTPLLLWMLCSLFQQSEQIPPNLGMVFRAFTVGYGDRIKQDVTLSKDSRAWWGRLLQYLAFKMTCGENLTELQVAISRREAEQFLVEFLRGKVEFADDCVVRWLEDLLKHHLIQISNDRIEFRHQLIQEYYAAEWLLGLLPSLSDARLQQGYLNYLKWTEPLALMLALVEGEEQAVRVVRLALEVDLRLGARLAGAVKYGFQEKTVGLLMREIEEQEIPKLSAIELLEQTESEFAIKSLTQILRNIDSYVRRNATRALGCISSEKAVEALIQTLKDIDPNVRASAAWALGSINSEKAVESLIQSLKDIDFNVRGNATQALVNIGSEKVVESLIQSLQDTNSSIRGSAALALGYIDSEKAVEPLIQALEDIDFHVRSEDIDFHVRSNLIDALGYIGDEKAVKPLIYALKDKKHLDSWNVEKALENIGCEKAVEPLIHALNDADSHMRGHAARILGNIGGEKAIKFLLKAVRDENHFVCWNAEEALGKIGSEKAVEPLIYALKDMNSNVRGSAAKTLGRLGSKQAVALLIQTLKDEDYDVRARSAWALGKIGSEKAIEPLIQALNDEDSFVRGSAAEALGEIGSEKAIEPLIQSLKDEDSEVRGNIVEALGKIGSEKAIEPLIQALNDEDSFVRGNAAEALGRLCNEKTIEPFIQSLKDEDSYVRGRSAWALGNIGSEKAVEPLIQALNDEDHDVHEAAEEALAKIGKDKTIESFIKAFKDESSYVHRSVAEALGNIGSEKAIEPLIQALNDEDSYVRENAVLALGNIGTEKAIEPLIQVLNDDYPYVRCAATWVLGNMNSEELVKPLIHILKDLDSSVRGEARGALVNITNADRNLPALTQQLPHLLTLIPTEASQEALSVITAIQARCKYYNYNIAQTPLQEENNNDKVLSNPQGNIINVTEIKNDFSNANFGGANIANLGGTVNEQKIVQKTEVPKQSLAEATKEVQELLNQLAKTNLSEATIANTIQQEIKRNPTLKARLVNALKTGGIEALKTIFNNPFVSIPVETVKGFLEAEE